MGRGPAGTRTHDDGGLSDAQPGTLGDDQGLDGVTEVLGRVLVGEELDRAPVGELEAGGGVRQPGAADSREDDGQELHRPLTRAAHLVVALTGETGTDDQVGGLCPGRVEEGVDLCRVVLTIGVELDGPAIAVALRIEVAGAHRSPHPEVQR